MIYFEAYDFNEDEITPYFYAYRVIIPRKEKELILKDKK